jgi:hypothetical protein
MFASGMPSPLLSELAHLPGENEVNGLVVCGPRFVLRLSGVRLVESFLAVQLGKPIS